MHLPYVMISMRLGMCMSDCKYVRVRIRQGIRASGCSCGGEIKSHSVPQFYPRGQPVLEKMQSVICDFETGSYR